ncbi:MAG: HGGxSTG domain-containing protein [Pseudomonadota bacterium]|nr:HGGxSTG domain-containing protein [Pseudomonadota bacterium]
MRNGNPPGDLRLARRCGARTRAGHPGCQPAMKNLRCRLHGGKSTGPRSVAGLARSRRARWVHGGRGRAYIEMRRDGMDLRRRINVLRVEISECMARDAWGLASEQDDRNPSPLAGEG